MKIAVVGAGIIGTCVAWSLAKRGHIVSLFDKDTPMAHTSQSSSKLLHGGLRYLETAQFGLVKESLKARCIWLNQAPHLCQPLELLFPIYKGAGRSKWQIGLGIKLYDFLAAGSGFPRGRWLDAQTVLKKSPHLNGQNLLGAYAFYDAQMDDYALGMWVVEQAQQAGVEVISHTQIENLAQLSAFEHIVNAAGPWAMQLRQQQSTKPPAYSLDWVRGSHIVLDQKIEQALMLPVLNEKRIFFVLPYQGKTLIGTTEVRQAQPESQEPSAEELNYLIQAYNIHHKQKIQLEDIHQSYSGVRPLIKSASNPSEASREWAFEKVANVLHVYGGKWTTAQVQGEAAVKELFK